jgi:hypothetical protein
MSKVLRNEACPCGSGKKYKSCCGGGEKSRTGVASGRILAVIVGVVVIGGLAIAVNQFRQTDLSEAGAANATPEPWEYNAVNNQHWDPTPGHEHWHNGPPPNRTGGNLVPSTTPAAGGFPALPPANPAATVPTPTPVAAAGDPGAWDYDAESDRHWNPNTRVWDQGMPPLEAFTSGNGE